MNTTSSSIPGEPDVHGSGCILLIAEDNLGDFLLLKRTLLKLEVQGTIVRATDGKETVDYLSNCGEAPLPPCPTHLILDLKMPRLSGFDVLQWIRAHDRLRALPVIVMSSSAIDSDIAKAQQLGIDAYMVKPAGLEQLSQVVRQIVDIWALPCPSRKI